MHENTWVPQNSDSSFEDACWFHSPYQAYGRIWFRCDPRFCGLLVVHVCIDASCLETVCRRQAYLTYVKHVSHTTKQLNPKVRAVHAGLLTMKRLRLEMRHCICRRGWLQGTRSLPQLPNRPNGALILKKRWILGAFFCMALSSTWILSTGALAQASHMVLLRSQKLIIDTSGLCAQPQLLFRV